jgi:peptidoglycan/LPS O-acetylase OafA/YrhL
LDALRGLAALMVVLHHLGVLWQTETQPTSAAIRAVMSLVFPFGTNAVMLFFVLSGFVLSLPAVAGRPQKYSTFVIRRIFRIYVPYLASLAVAVIGACWLHGMITRSSWFNVSWPGPVDWHLVGQHVLFLGSYDHSVFNKPIWSLIFEMRISLLFPLLCALVLWFRSRWSLAMILVLAAGPMICERLPFGLTLQYASLFVFGIALARERDRLGALLRRLPRWAKMLIGVVFLWLFLFAGTPANWPGHAFQNALAYVSMWITALGAGGLMIVSINWQSCKRVLLWRPIHFLGEVSYSLYLWHFVVMLYCVHLLYGRLPFPAILCLCFVASIFVSWCSYRWIEVPSMNLGRRLSNFPGGFPARPGASTGSVESPAAALGPRSME